MSETTAGKTTPAQSHDIAFPAAFWVWVREALHSSDSPAGQMAVMHRILLVSS